MADLDLLKNLALLIIVLNQFKEQLKQEEQDSLPPIDWLF